jgi:hypothetical protein
MASSQPGGYDALGEFVDFSQIEFENANGSAAANANTATNAGNDVFTSTLSPPTSSNMSPAPTLKSESSGSGEVFSGPSHQYSLYKQQTPFVPGALHTAMAMAAPHNFYQDYLNQTSLDDVFDFNTPLETTGLDMDFQTSYLNSTINPNVINGQNGESLTSPLPSTTTTSTGSTFVRPWPGMHQQAALARAQQQRQQLERQRAMAQQAAKQVQKPRTPQTSDSIAQQSVQQIMNAIRAEPVAPAPVKISPTLNFPKKQKTEEEMDPDEKFLASEEAKKLDSRERRQLRNKVSARAFRSRRKGKFCPSVRLRRWFHYLLSSQNTSAGLRMS